MKPRGRWASDRARLQPCLWSSAAAPRGLKSAVRALRKPREWRGAGFTRYLSKADQSAIVVLHRARCCLPGPRKQQLADTSQRADRHPIFPPLDFIEASVFPMSATAMVHSRPRIATPFTISRRCCSDPRTSPDGLFSIMKKPGGPYGENFRAEHVPVEALGAWEVVGVDGEMGDLTGNHGSILHTLAFAGNTVFCQLMPNSRHGGDRPACPDPHLRRDLPGRGIRRIFRFPRARRNGTS